jgi:Na+/H+ antiporter NhaA
MFGGKLFISVHKDTATLGYIAMFIASILLAANRMRRDRIAGYLVCLASIPASMIGSAVTAVLTAVVMAYGLDKPLTYFRKEWWCLVLYGPSTLLGMP